MADLVRLRGDAVEWREVDGEIVALDLRDSTYLAVNPSGVVVWTALVTGATRQQLLARLTEAFGIDEQTAARDLDDFLRALEERDLLDLGGDAAA